MGAANLQHRCWKRTGEIPLCLRDYRHKQLCGISVCVYAHYRIAPEDIQALSRSPCGVLCFRPSFGGLEISLMR